MPSEVVLSRLLREAIGVAIHDLRSSVGSARGNVHVGAFGCMFHTGEAAGSPEDTLDTAGGLYLNDPSARN